MNAPDRFTMPFGIPSTPTSVIQPGEEIIDADYIEVPLTPADTTVSVVGEAATVSPEPIDMTASSVDMPPPEMPPSPNHIHLDPEIAAALTEAGEGGVITNQALIDFLNGLSAQKQTEVAAGGGNADSTLAAYEALQNKEAEQAVARKQAKYWLNKFDIGQSLLKSIAKSILVTNDGWYAMMMAPQYNDQPLSPYIRGWDNKAMNKLFKRIDLYHALATYNEPTDWTFGFQRLRHPVMTVKIQRIDNMDYETACGMAFATYLQHLHH